MVTEVRVGREDLQTETQETRPKMETLSVLLRGQTSLLLILNNRTTKRGRNKRLRITKRRISLEIPKKNSKLRTRK
jgi:hypothetical protein